MAYSMVRLQPRIPPQRIQCRRCKHASGWHARPGWSPRRDGMAARGQGRGPQAARASASNGLDGTAPFPAPGPSPGSRSRGRRLTIPNICSMMVTMNRGLAGFCRVQCGPAGRCGDGEEVGDAVPDHLGGRLHRGRLYGVSGGLSGDAAGARGGAYPPAGRQRCCPTLSAPSWHNAYLCHGRHLAACT